jgi:hypothetical protein
MAQLHQALNHLKVVGVNLLLDHLHYSHLLAVLSCLLAR